MIGLGLALSDCTRATSVAVSLSALTLDNLAIPADAPLYTVVATILGVSEGSNVEVTVGQDYFMAVADGGVWSLLVSGDLSGLSGQNPLQLTETNPAVPGPMTSDLAIDVQPVA